METMAREYQRRGYRVDILTFTLQYPALLFPGKSQTVDTPPPADLSIERCVSTVNPLTWWQVGRKLCKLRPDIVLMKYWTPFMAPCFGSIARLARKNGHTRVICQIDNVEPHEHHITDKMFNRYYLSSVDGFIYMSEQVHGELEAYTHAPALFSPHPMFEHFGPRKKRTEACNALGIDPNEQYALFFGLIRDYKGLDTLIEAWAAFRRKGHKLLIAGEFYASRDKYIDLIARLGLQDDIILHDHFIPDSEVANYFSASDCVVLPYKTATQSGVTQIAYNFRTPIIVTDVGGLKEIVPDGVVGYVVESSTEGVADGLRKIYEQGRIEEFTQNMEHERKRFSWSAMCDKIEEVYDIINSK
ncbi:MAG: glycosyltransferase family 4 protein [Alistipes sp.]|nr:glycosyltransferase family 4 protein [Alistipes sp.]